MLSEWNINFLFDMKNELDDQPFPIPINRNGTCVRKEFKNTLNELSAVRNFISHICKQAEFVSEDFITEIELCVHEAVANIIKHAYQNEVDRPIIIECTYEENKGLHIDIYDLGIPFVPDPLQFSELPLEAEAGRGLFLMHMLSEVLEFHPRNAQKEWNHLYLFKSYPRKVRHESKYEPRK
jgi:anti-sigma regulatory factor (Ser/Thr protein kinase)